LIIDVGCFEMIMNPFCAYWPTVIHQIPIVHQSLGMLGLIAALKHYVCGSQRNLRTRRRSVYGGSQISNLITKDIKKINNFILASDRWPKFEQRCLPCVEPLGSHKYLEKNTTSKKWQQKMTAATTKKWKSEDEIENKTKIEL
jgi:hypothetical protein